ncbi:MAG TPA: hypothetical protein VM580_25930 [Labilithrix sp.]|nr:hypothetical protein [Labilithrix sp.]
MGYETISHYSGSAQINRELNDVLRDGRHVKVLSSRRKVGHPLAPRNKPFYVTVLINVVRWAAALHEAQNAAWRSGHVALMFWSHTSRRYASCSITNDPNDRDATELVSPEIENSRQIRRSNTIDLWLYSRKITESQLKNMIKCIQRLHNMARYRMFAGSRYSGTFNCVTFVDFVLSSAGPTPFKGLSTGVNPLSMSTPYAYSLSFSRRNWTCGYRRNHTTIPA